MIIKHGRHIFGEIHEERKGLWASFLDCTFGMLIGWAENLRSRGKFKDFSRECELNLTCDCTHGILLLLFIFLSNNRLRRVEPSGERREANHDLYGFQTVHEKVRWGWVLGLRLPAIGGVVRGRAEGSGFPRSRRGSCDRRGWRQA